MSQDPTTPTDDFVPSYLLYLLAASSEAASAEFHETVRKAGVRVPEWRVLACLHDEDGQMITRLAELALAEQSRLTRIIDGMVKRGLLERRDDAADRRRVRIYLTKTGKTLAKDLIEKARLHEEKLLIQLPEGQIAALKPALAGILDALRRE